MLENLLFEHDACGVGFLYRPQKSHQVLRTALHALERMEHRGASSADKISSDGAGILTSIPWKVFDSEGWGISNLTERNRRVAVIVCFIPAKYSQLSRDACEQHFSQQGFEIIGWRAVPTDDSVLGPLAEKTRPEIEHLLVSMPTEWTDRDAELRLTELRKQVINHVWRQTGSDEFYVASASSSTIVYKAMVSSSALPQFYTDLNNELFETNWVVFHRRFSTNTVPRWRLAQPFRLLGHNGEINTLQGNRHWLKARESFAAARESDDIRQPLINRGSSDSANLDNVLEFFVNRGEDPEEALMKLIPEPALSKCKTLDERIISDFYEYHAALQEPWDGPALIVYSDGRSVGALLDRNGLRPARYTVLNDGSICLGSEAGIVDFPFEQVIEKGRLGPGQMIAVDLKTGKIRKDKEIKLEVSKRLPYSELLAKTRCRLNALDAKETFDSETHSLATLQAAAGYSSEDVDFTIKPMATTKHEPVFSMGDDTTLACLSQQPRLLYDFFKQRFAQVTNPPIDHLRERFVMSLDVYLRGSDDQVLKLSNPVLSSAELRSLAQLGQSFQSQKVSTTFACDASLDEALTSVVQSAVQHAQRGTRLLILSDRDFDENNAIIPPLLAVAAVHQRLIELGLRLQCNLVVETAQCWTIHQYACLLSYGAQLICPYLAWQTVHALALDVPESASEPLSGPSQEKYHSAVTDGILKIMSKMGISALTSYIGAETMECVGLGPVVIARCFGSTTSPAYGLEISDIAKDVLRFHHQAFPKRSSLPNYGLLKFKKDGEYHANNPDLIKSLHQALRLRQTDSSPTESRDNFFRYSTLLKTRAPYAVRDLLQFHADRSPVALETVELADAIVKRFCTGGMSLGSLSKETHETVAIAMNRMGAKSNSGEGGEDPRRYYPISNVTAQGTSPDFPGLTGLHNGDRASSAIRQVASARFGVTAEYLVTAEQLEIKIAQGAKPGEGGQLPGSKNSEYIASLRRAQPGITLISPPPHHDIYSIEDLAQLIFDLRQVNPHAKVSVKLVSSTGIGTIASGVAKAGADIIQISGHDGGTGASPIASIKHAGLPWEFGLAEAHRNLLANGLRKKVTLRVDGGLRSGSDVVTAALLGADEFGFGSIALISLGCIMARVCHTNNCPVGITTQKEQLRQKFAGKPEHLVELFHFIAEEVRQELAELGYHSLQEIIGRNDLLRRVEQPLAKADLNLDLLLSPTPSPQTYSIDSQHYSIPDPAIGDQLIADPEIREAIESHASLEKAFSVNNFDRTIGARIAGAIAKRWGDSGFEGNIRLVCTGAAGQSFGAFNVRGMSLSLEGEANDYVGKGMSGGQIVIVPPQNMSVPAGQNVIAGNTCLYGATGGELFVAGQAGERFAVRNCNARAVVEGVGVHGCEYMTGGVVVVLGTQASFALPAVQAPDLPNYFNVVPGVYRGGQPTNAGLEQLSKQGIKTIISFRNNKTVTDGESAEAKKLNLKFYSMPLTGRTKPSAEMTRRFLAIVSDPQSQPVFIHCEEGVDRTGTMIAIYRVSEDHWTAGQAYREMLAHGFHTKYIWLANSVFDWAAQHGVSAAGRPLSGRLFNLVGLPFHVLMLPGQIAGKQ